MTSEASSESYDYSYDSQPTKKPQNEPPANCTDVLCVLEASAYVFIMVLGIIGNGLVIWIAGFKIKKTVNTVWYLSLAVSDFLFCSFLPLSIVYKVKNTWIFGHFMCKFASLILILNMFSSIFLLVIISVDRCVVVMFPVWAQNKRTLRGALVMVLFALISASLLSLPAVIFRELAFIGQSNQGICHNNYISDEQHTAVVECRFIFGFVIPLLVISICYILIIRKLKANQMARSNKPFKIMTALIVAFSVSWMPYHLFSLLELNVKYISVAQTGQLYGMILASANSFMNPLLYAFMGKDFKRKCFALLFKTESTLGVEGRSTLRGTSITHSGDGKVSVTV